MLEGSECGSAIAIQLTVRAVVKAKDVAGAAAFGGSACAAFQVTLSVLCNGLHAWNQPLGRLSSPVSWDQGPHSGSIAEFSRRRNDPGIAHAKGRAKPLRRGTKHAADRVVAKA